MFAQIYFTGPGNIASWMTAPPPIPGSITHAVKDLPLEFKFLVSFPY